MRLLLLLFLLLCPVVAGAHGLYAPQAPSAHAGPDRTVLVNEPLSLDGSGSTGWFDGMRPNSDQYSVSWDFGYGGWTYQTNVIAPVIYPKAGVYTATITVCNAAGTCASDSTTVTVNAITEGVVTTVSDTGNPTTNGANLCAAMIAAASASSPVIEVVAGVTYRMNGQPCVLPNRTGAGYLTLRTTSHALLPDGTSRVFPADAALMATIEPGPHPNNPAINSADAAFRTPVTSLTPSHHYRFIGLHFAKTFPTLSYTARAFVDIGRGDETTLAQLPHHFQIDRCFFDGGSTTSSTLRGIGLVGSDLAVVNSYLYRFKGPSLETQAIFVGQGERIAVLNNYLSAAAECMLIGGADPRIPNHVPTDLVIRRNNMEKDLGWCSFCGSYYGVDMTVKNLWEAKLGLRISNQGNFYHVHWAEDQNWAITVTVRNQSGNAPWSDISYLDFSYNHVQKVAEGTQILGNDNLQASQSIDHILFRHVVYSGISFYNGRHNTFTITQASGGTTNGLYLVRTSTDSNGVNGQGRWIEFDVSTGFSNCVFIGNVAQGFINAAGQLGNAAMVRACSTSSYSVVKNGFYLSSGTNPTGNSSVATRALVGFTDIATFNLALLPNSPFIATGLGGEESGADVAAVNVLTAGCLTGAWPESGSSRVLSGKPTLSGKVTINE